MSTVLETRGLAKRFGGVVATSDVTFRLERGARHALIGPNGAGKTTLLRTLCGLQRPSAGEVRIHGQSLSQDRDLLRQIGFTPDTPPLVIRQDDDVADPGEETQEIREVGRGGKGRILTASQDPGQEQEGESTAEEGGSQQAVLPHPVQGQELAG